VRAPPASTLPPVACGLFLHGISWTRRWNQLDQDALHRIKLNGVDERVGGDVEETQKDGCVVADIEHREVEAEVHK